MFLVNFQPTLVLNLAEELVGTSSNYDKIELNWSQRHILGLIEILSFFSFTSCEINMITSQYSGRITANRALFG